MRIYCCIRTAPAETSSVRRLGRTGPKNSEKTREALSDIHHALGVPMQQYIPSIGPQEVRKIHTAYTLAREAFGLDIDIIVHCHCELDTPSAIKVAEAVEHIKPLFYEDPLAPSFSESWLALRRTTRIPLMTGENIELSEGAMPFLQNQAVDYLQPDLLNSGGITGTKMIADLAALYRIPVCLLTSAAWL